MGMGTWLEIQYEAWALSGVFMTMDLLKVETLQ